MDRLQLHDRERFFPVPRRVRAKALRLKNFAQRLAKVAIVVGDQNGGKLDCHKTARCAVNSFHRFVKANAKPAFRRPEFPSRCNRCAVFSPWSSAAAPIVLTALPIRFCNMQNDLEEVWLGNLRVLRIMGEHVNSAENCRESLPARLIVIAFVAAACKESVPPYTLRVRAGNRRRPEKFVALAGVVRGGMFNLGGL